MSGIPVQLGTAEDGSLEYIADAVPDSDISGSL